MVSIRTPLGQVDSRRVCAVSMVRMTLCSCSTLLCLRLCSSAVGRIRVAGQETAVPGHDVRRTCFSSLLIRIVAAVLQYAGSSCQTIEVPRRQVHIMSATLKPKSSGTMRLEAVQKIRSEEGHVDRRQAAKSPPRGAPARQRHKSRNTMNASSQSTTMVAVTAMP